VSQKCRNWFQNEVGGETEEVDSSDVWRLGSCENFAGEKR